MTYTVFLSGSRKISRLNDDIRDRLQTIVDKDFMIVVGDANGADKAFQNYLAKINYGNVVVFCAGDICRNNVGSWKQNNIYVDKKFSGRDFYTQKDKAMAKEADYGFIVWDGKSAGSINNALELLDKNRPSILYYSPNKSFYSIKSVEDFEGVIKLVNMSDFRNMDEKIHFEKRLKNLHGVAQGALSL